MTDYNHPITPPPKLVREWNLNGSGTSEFIATQAARWGADQELNACCEEMKSIPSPLGIPFGEMASNALRAARRPKPPTLKERACTALAEPEPEGPTDEDLMALAVKVFDDPFATDKDYARAVLARWGNHPANPDTSLQPIPVSEGIPEPKDCNKEGWCWWLVEQYQPPLGPGGKFWVLCRYSLGSTHWLPAHALPLPTHE